MTNSRMVWSGVALSAGLAALIVGVSAFVLLSGASSNQQSKQKLPQIVLKGHKRAVEWVAFSPDGQSLATAGDDGIVIVWNLATKTRRFELTGIRNTVSFVVYSPCGSFLVSESHQAIVWDAKTGQKICSLEGHTRPVVCGAFSPDGKAFATGSVDQTIKLWDTTTWQEYATLKGHDAGVDCVAFGADSNILVSGSGDKTVKVWDVLQKKELLTLGEDKPGVWSNVLSMAFAPGGKILATGSENQKLKLWDIVEGKEKQTLEGHGHRIRTVIYSPDGSKILSGSDDGTLKVWDATTGRECFSLRFGDRVRCLAFSKDGKTLAIANGTSAYLCDEALLVEWGILPK